ncbi:hypothetical protein HDV00_007376 [Rhizophlyctis rosea]|nr:hypothetical protein HDV00_007376 [Rhizophlyctis rosea]
MAKKRFRTAAKTAKSARSTTAINGAKTVASTAPVSSPTLHIDPSILPPEIWRLTARHTDSITIRSIRSSSLAKDVPLVDAEQAFHTNGWAACWLSASTNGLPSIIGWLSSHVPSYKSGNLECLNIALAAGADVNLRCILGAGKLGGLPTTVALENNHMDIVQALIGAGSHLHQISLGIPAGKNNIEMVKFYLIPALFCVPTVSIVQPGPVV